MESNRWLRDDFAYHVCEFDSKELSRIADLHDWLIIERGLPLEERVLGIANYQPVGRDRSPQVLLLTEDRFSYTTPTHMRSLPLYEINTNNVGFKAHLAEGHEYAPRLDKADLELVTHKGERLSFRRGYARSIGNIATELNYHAMRRADRLGPEGWWPDPYGRRQERWFDGYEWTDAVRDGGEVSSDPVKH